MAYGEENGTWVGVSYEEKKEKGRSAEKKEEREQIIRHAKVAALIMVALNMFGICLDLDLLLYLEIIPGAFCIIAAVCLIILAQE